MPKVSVVMGVYNVLNIEILKESINSILNQTFEDYEFIICDDGSTNNTKQMIKEIIKGNKKVKFIENEINKGLAYSLNYCLEKAEGEYIARMDSDDISEKNRLEKQVEFLDNNPKFVAVATNSNLFDESGKWGERTYPEIIQKKDFLFTNPIAHPTIMMRKKELEEVGNYTVNKDTIRAEDYDLWMKFYEKGYKIHTIQEKLFNIREDKQCFKRRKYRYRIGEAKIKYRGYKKLGLFPKGYIYVLKPLIVGLIPQKILKEIRNIRKKEKI